MLRSCVRVANMLVGRMYEARKVLEELNDRKGSKGGPTKKNLSTLFSPLYTTTAPFNVRPRRLRWAPVNASLAHCCHFPRVHIIYLRGLVVQSLM